MQNNLGGISVSQNPAGKMFMHLPCYVSVNHLQVYLCEYHWVGPGQTQLKTRLEAWRSKVKLRNIRLP